MADGIGFLAGNPIVRLLDGTPLTIEQTWLLDFLALRDRVGGFNGGDVLTALAAYDTDGILVQTATATFAGRTITGTSNQITVANGSGVAGNPTLSLPADVLIPTILTIPLNGLHLLDTNATHDLIVAVGSNLTADRTLTITTGDANRTLDISAASVTISADAALMLADADVMRLGTSNIMTGSTFRINSTLPQFFWDQTNATTNERFWDAICFGDQWRLRAISDDGLSADQAILIARTAHVIDSLTFGASLLTDANNTNDIGNSTNAWRVGYVQTVELGHASDTTFARASAGRPTVEGVAVRLAGRNDIWIPASAMTAPATNGASALQTDESAGVSYQTRDFDQTTQEFAHFHWTPPKSWNGGTVTFNPYWRPGSGVTTGNVVFALQGVAISNDDPMDATLGTEQTSDDTFIAANDLHIGPESSAITIGGTPADADFIAFRIKRNVSADNLDGDARLIGILLHATTNASEDT